MDPDACFDTIQDALDSLAGSRAREYADYLTAWLERGGFAPDWAKHPEAARYVGRRYRFSYPAKVAEAGLLPYVHA